MTGKITPKQFRESEGVEDWRVLGDGANAYFRTGSLAKGARLVHAISEFPGIDELQPDIDVRHDGVTVRMVAFIEGYGGMLQGHVELARKISAAARKLGFSADPTAVQSVLVIPGATSRSEVMPFWQAVLGYEPRRDSPAEDLSIRATEACRSGSSKWRSRVRTAAARSISRCGCHSRRRRHASRPHLRPAAGWCATNSRPRGGHWPTRRVTRRTSPRRRGATSAYRLATVILMQVGVDELRKRSR